MNMPMSWTRYIDALGEITDPAERVVAAQNLMGDLMQLHSMVSTVRADTVAELHHTQGWALEDIAGLLGVSRQRVKQILDSSTMG